MDRVNVKLFSMQCDLSCENTDRFLGSFLLKNSLLFSLFPEHAAGSTAALFLCPSVKMTEDHVADDNKTMSNCQSHLYIIKYSWVSTDIIKYFKVALRFDSAPCSPAKYNYYHSPR